MPRRATTTNLTRRTAGAPAESRDGHAFAAIYRVVRSIPKGRVATYGQVALLAGMPGAARTVGWALRALDQGAHRGRAVPWHRVLGAGGVISLGATASGELQRERLRKEGVRFRNGRVVMERFALGAAQTGQATPGGRAGGASEFLGSVSSESSTTTGEGAGTFRLIPLTMSVDSRYPP